MKWFSGIQSMDELKSRYRELCKAHHPDVGGSTAEMQEINAEYDELLHRFARDEHTGNAEEAHHAAQEAEAYRDIINALVTFPGLCIELCGRWIWISGNTYAARDTLKALGCCWATIREKYGSEVIKGEPVKVLA